MLRKNYLFSRIVKSVITLALCLPVFILTSRTAQTLTIHPGQQEASREGLEFFEKKIRPVLVDNCYACHSEQTKKPQGGLLLDSIEGMLKGGSSGAPALTPGDPEKSLLI